MKYAGYLSLRNTRVSIKSFSFFSKCLSFIWLIAYGSNAIALPPHIPRDGDNIYIGFSGSEKNSFFLSLSYYGDFFTKIGELKGLENVPNLNSTALVTISPDGIIQQKANINYRTNFLAGGVSLGYSMGGTTKIEIEGQYATLRVNDKDFKNKDDASYLEIARIKDGVSGLYNANNQVFKNDKNSFSILSYPNGIVPNPGTRFASFDSTKDFLATKYSNEGIGFINGFVNVGYNVNIKGIPISPYIALGIGISRTTFLRDTAYGLAYQVKGGLSLDFNEHFSVFAGYNYRGTFKPQKYTSVTPTTGIVGVKSSGNVVTAPEKEIFASGTSTFEMPIGLHGLTAGLIFKF